MPGMRLSSSRGAAGLLVQVHPGSCPEAQDPPRLHPGKRGQRKEKGELEASLEDVASEWSGVEGTALEPASAGVLRKRSQSPPCSQLPTGEGPRGTAGRMGRGQAGELQMPAGLGLHLLEMWSPWGCRAGEKPALSPRRFPAAGGSSCSSDCWVLGTALLLPSELCVAVVPSGQGRKAGRAGRQGGEHQGLWWLEEGLG